MKAVLLMNHGGPEMLRYGDAPDPTAGPAEVVATLTRPASTRPITKCDWEAVAPICGSHISWAVTSRAWSAPSARVSLTSPSVMRCSESVIKVSKERTQKRSPSRPPSSPRSPTALAMPRRPPWP